jgi:hypothetical protein
MSAGSHAVAALRRIERWIFEPGSARRLAGVRIGLCLLMAGRLSRTMYLQLAGQPRALFRPISFMHLFPAMPSAGIILAVQIVAVGACLMGAAGVYTRAALPVAWLGSLFLNGLWTSVGQPMHNETLLILAMFPLLLARTTDAWSITARRRVPAAPGVSVRYGWPVRTAMITVAGGYFFSGLYKVLFSGPAWVFSNNLRWVMYAISDQNGHPISFAIFLASHPLLAHAAAAAALLTELTFPITLWKPITAWLFVPGVVLLHLGIGLTMHLDYSAWALTAIIMFVPWEVVADRLRRPAGEAALVATAWPERLPLLRAGE